LGISSTELDKQPVEWVTRMMEYHSAKAQADEHNSKTNKRS